MFQNLLKNKIKAAILALIISNIIWGAASPVFKWSLENIHPFTLAYLRFTLAVLLLFPFVYKDLYLHKKDIKLLFLSAFFGITINISFFFLGLNETASINAPLIASSAPIFILFSSMIFLKEKISRKTVVGTLIGLLGVITIVITPLFNTGLDSSLLGNLYLILATCGAIVHVILAKELADKYKPLPIIFYSFIIASLTFTPLFLGEALTYGFLPNLGIQGIVGIIYGAVFASSIAYATFHWGIQYLKASEVGLFTYMDPIVAVLIAMPLLGEIPTPEYIVGAILVFLGIFIAEGRLHYHPFHKLK